MFGPRNPSTYTFSLASPADLVASPARLSTGDETASNSKLESFLKHLIERGLVDNVDDSSETVHRFLEIYEQFEEENEMGISASAERQGDFSCNPFETRAIFTLADFLKSLGPNEFYDIAQKVYNRWEKESNNHVWSQVLDARTPHPV